MITISLNKQAKRENRLIEKLLGGKRTKENLDRFKALSPPELRLRIREILSEEIINGKPRFSLESLKYKQGLMGALQSEIQQTDKRYRMDTGISTMRGVDHNFEFEYCHQLYHFSAGKDNSEKNGDTLISVIPDRGAGSEIHAVFDGTTFCRFDHEASSYAATVLGKAGVLGLIDNQSDIANLLRDVHEHLAGKGLSTTATIALIKDNELVLSCVGDSPAVLFKKIEKEYGMQLISAGVQGFLGHESFDKIGQTKVTFSENDILMILSDGFVDLKEKVMVEWLVKAFQETKNRGFIGFGATLNHPRLHYGRLTLESIGGPIDDASVLIVKKS